MRCRPAINTQLLPIALLLFLVPFLLPVCAFAGEWQVIPIRLDLDRVAKSGVLTIKNRGDESLNVQIKAFEWSQDAEGKDLYAESSDLVFLPRIATIEKQTEQVVRVGVKFPATGREKTYRLFIEEIPKPRKAESSSISIAIRFGVPIFVKPLKDELHGEIAGSVLSKGVLDATVKNSGNVHFNIDTLTIRLKKSTGEEVFAKEIKGWYLLAGVSRLYSTPIPLEACKSAATAELEVKTDRLNMKGKLDINGAACLP